MSAAFLCKAVDLAETQTSSAPTFCLEEWLKHVLEYVGRNARSQIGDRDKGIISLVHVGIRVSVSQVQLGIGSLDEEGSARFHGIAGVDREVEDGSLELGGVDFRMPQIGGQRGTDVNLLSQCALKQVRHSGHLRVDVDDPRLEGLSAGNASSLSVSPAARRAPRVAFSSAQAEWPPQLRLPLRAL